MQFPIHQPHEVEKPIAEILQSAEQEIGFIPNLLSVMAAAPSLVRAYVDLQNSFAATSLSPAEQEVVLLAASYENRCNYCVPVHTATATHAGVSADVIAGLRSGQPLPNPRFEALKLFTAAVISGRGTISRDQFREFETAGFSANQALEVILGVTVKTLSTYTNHLTMPPLDDALLPAKWEAG